MNNDTNTAPQEAQQKQAQALWSDADIVDHTRRNADAYHSVYEAMRFSMQMVRNDYEGPRKNNRIRMERLEAELSASRAREDELRAELTRVQTIYLQYYDRIVELEGQLAEARKWVIFGDYYEEYEMADLEAHLCNTCSYEVNTRKQIDELTLTIAELVATMKLVYRKHHLEDDSIGWDELTGKVLDALSNAMGVEELVKWQESEGDL